MRVTYAKRLPPGDRWQIDNEIFDSLTDCLNQIFLRERLLYLKLMPKLVKYIDDGNEAPQTAS